MVFAAIGCGATSIQVPTPPAGANAPAPVSAKGAETGAFLVVRGEGFDPVEIPRAEELVFQVEVDLGDAKPEPPRSVGWIRSQARGSYLGYELSHELDVRHLPQTWPSIFYRDSQAGSENRRRELKFGVLDGKATAILRNDGHCKGCANPEHFIESAWIWGKPYHCEKCKRAEHRIWNDPHTRAIPPGTVDLLSAVYLARSMVRRGDAETTFPVLDKLRLWTLTIRRGTHKVIETPAGRFDCVYAQLSTAVPPDEPRDEKGFQGLFGIQGSIRIWMDSATGVPVTITGELPVPVVHTIELNIRLKSYRGTPPSFQPKS